MKAIFQMSYPPPLGDKTRINSIPFGSLDEFFGDGRLDMQTKDIFTG